MAVVCPSCRHDNDPTVVRCAGCGASLAPALLATDPMATDPMGALPNAPFAPGKLISHYRIEGQLGAGGMGVVYRATDVNLRRAVALKFLPPARAADAGARARFVREARAASALDHPHIGTVYEIGDDPPFIAMALYEGETLQQRIARGPLLPDEVERIMTALADALAAAHTAGIVHRDLKPANVMLPADGGVKLLDFGLAKLAGDEDQSLTREGALMGTLAYMAPEQLRGEVVDARADLWALGAILYEMLTAQRAFPGDSLAVVTTQILHTPPPRVPSTAPPYLSAIVEQLLVQAREQRVESASRLALMLKNREAPKRPRRRRLLLAGTALLVLLGAGVTLLRPTHDNDATAKQKAQKLYEAGMAKFLDDKFDEAAAIWEQGYQAYGNAPFLYNIGKANRLAHHRERALTAYRAYLQMSPDAPNREEVAEEIAQLQPSPNP